MMHKLLLTLSFVFFTFSSFANDTLKLEGLQAPVEVYRDPWGINHIYAENEHDLFFAQGYCAARDRLFQFEVWRRQTEGTVAEILGERELKRDIGTRLFKFRGNMRQEMNHYHPHGEAIIKAFVEGVNAYIGETEKNADLLPMEFELLGIRPGYWTPENVISRHQGLLGNIGQEMQIGRAVALLGPDKVNQLMNFHPDTPDLALDTAINVELLFDDILELYNAYRQSVTFRPEDIVNAKWRAEADMSEQLMEERQMALANLEEERESIGSNNWVVSGEHTQSGFPIMANDPHRTQAVPSLRYWVHLNAPGWNVIGGGEPEIPGISIGHNEYGAWGLTVFRTDGEDLYVYDTNPDDPSQYRYQERWEDMRVIEESIAVKGQEDVSVALKYTRHGPVVYEDTVNHKAYAIRCAWLEVGGSPYLASLRMDQAKSWEEFREACSYSNIPGENMVWADKDGNIGWQAVGIAPIRPHWSGLVPVSGDGRYEWDGYLPIKAKPHVYNPESGIKATANEKQVPDGYPYRNAVGYSWSDSYRADRLAEVLNTGKKHSLMDMAQLQTDYLSIPARNLVPLLKGLEVNDRQTAQARALLLDWDYRLEANSVAAAIYDRWEDQLKDNMHALMVPEKAQKVITSLPMTNVLNWLVSPLPEMGESPVWRDPVEVRDRLLISSLEEAVNDLNNRLGNDMNDWQYGQEDYKHILLRHPLSAAVNAQTRAQLDVGPYPRGGNSYTVGSTGGNDNQSSGASFRLIVDTGDWDRALGSNTPGQSGDPDSPYYRNLFEQWAQDRYFPVYYSKEKVEQAAQEVLRLQP
ncbi:penicillin amidase [Catalinimonas alkaloidigena]|uniref:penicillin acylase family protein n=1 Tax=Catalinimonas alkaloidigena TaxID=1075417 RepID=UPI0030B8B395|nr:penicillin amidase [Catalinimonas alkaloidigena]